MPPPPAPPVPAAEPASAAPDAGPAEAGRPDPYERGLGLRREVLGDAHVDQALADDADGAFQELVTRYAWGEVWSREGLDRRMRSAVTLTALIAGGHREALADHTRAALRNGLSPEELREIVLHAGVYCGLPAAETALGVVARAIAEETTPRRSLGP